MSIRSKIEAFAAFIFNNEKKFYAQLIHKNDLCFDIGANIGKKSKLFLYLGAKVTAFEPQTACHSALNQIQKSNENFEFYPFAIGAANEEKELFLATHSEVATLSPAFMDYFRTKDIFWPKKEIVQVKTLNTIIENHGLPNYCKIDVESYEFEVLNQLAYTIPVIEFEFTGGFIHDTIKILNGMNDDKKRFNYIRNEKLKFQLKNWVSCEEMKTIILSLETDKLHGNIFVKSIA
jgi:FkbM family methyltransferase